VRGRLVIREKAGVAMAAVVEEVRPLGQRAAP
jgi:hypothetical protein